MSSNLSSTSHISFLPTTAFALAIRRSCLKLASCSLNLGWRQPFMQVEIREAALPILLILLPLHLHLLSTRRKGMVCHRHRMRIHRLRMPTMGIMRNQKYMPNHHNRHMPPVAMGYHRQAMEQISLYRKRNPVVANSGLS